MEELIRKFAGGVVSKSNIDACTPPRGAQRGPVRDSFLMDRIPFVGFGTPACEKRRRKMGRDDVGGIEARAVRASKKLGVSSRGFNTMLILDPSGFFPS